MTYASVTIKGVKNEALSHTDRRSYVHTLKYGTEIVELKLVTSFVISLKFTYIIIVIITIIIITITIINTSQNPCWRAPFINYTMIGP